MILNWINMNSGAIQALSTTILVIVTGIYVWWTRKSVIIIQKNEEKRNEPRVVGYLESSEGWLSLVYLVIGNYGREIAKNITFTVNDDIDLIHDGKKLSGLRPFSKGIKSLTPQRVLRIPIVSMVGRVPELSARNVVLTIKYQDSFDNKFMQKCDLDFNALTEYQIGKPPIYEISDSLKQIKDSLKKIERNK